MNLLKYVYFSNIRTCQDWNPFVWSFKLMHQPPSWHDPHLHIILLQILFLTVIIVIDDGSIQKNPPYRERISNRLKEW